MKNFKLTLIAFLIILSGCEKEEEIKPLKRTSQIQQNEFIGTWITSDYFCDEQKLIIISYLNDSTVRINNTELKIYLNTIKSSRDSFPWYEGQLNDTIMRIRVGRENITCTALFTKQ